jgi:hypothetical protein
MVINKKIRIQVAKKRVTELMEDNKNCNPYGYRDCYEIYKELEYWEDLLEELNK